MKLNWKLFAPLVVAIIVWLIGAPEGLSAVSYTHLDVYKRHVKNNALVLPVH